MENYNLDHLFANLMDDLDNLVNDAKITSKKPSRYLTEKYQCRVCGKESTLNNVVHIITQGFFCPPCVPKKK